MSQPFSIYMRPDLNQQRMIRNMQRLMKRTFVILFYLLHKKEYPFFRFVFHQAVKRVSIKNTNNPNIKLNRNRRTVIYYILFFHICNNILQM